MLLLRNWKHKFYSELGTFPNNEQYIRETILWLAGAIIWLMWTLGLRLFVLADWVLLVAWAAQSPTFSRTHVFPKMWRNIFKFIVVLKEWACPVVSLVPQLDKYTPSGICGGRRFKPRCSKTENNIFRLDSPPDRVSLGMSAELWCH